MRIVFLPVSAAIGGAERVLLEMLRAVRQAEPGWPLFLIAPGDGPLVPCARDLGVGVEVLPFPARLAELGDYPEASGRTGRSLRLAGRLSAASWPSYQYLRSLRGALRRIDPAVVHGNGLKMNLLGAWARPPGAAVVWHVHDYVSPRPLASRLVRRACSRCDRAIAVSQSVAEDMQRVCGPRVPVDRIHNPVALDTFAPDGPVSDLDAPAGLPPSGDGTVRVGLVATLAHWKGHRTFLDALAALPAKMLVRGYVVGGPIYQTRGSQHALDSLRLYAAQIGLGSRVGFTGFVDRPADAMRALDIVVHASTSPEPFGLVVAEAMACGRAVVASNAGGVQEIVEPGVDALVHPPGDAGALANCIATLAADAALRRRLGQAARRAAVTRFTRERFAAELMAVYRNIRSIGHDGACPSDPP